MNRTFLNVVAPPLKRLTRFCCAPFNLQRLTRIAAEGDVDAARLAKATLAAASSSIHENDRPWIKTIEACRSEWLQDDRPFIGEHNQADAGTYDFNQSIRETALASKDARRATVLYQFVDQFQPTCGIELGTNLGISSAYQALAMRHHHSEPAFHVFDLSKARLDMARALHEKLPVPFITAHHGAFQNTLAKTLDTLPRLDYAFVDGHHQYEPSHTYTNLICQHANPGAVIVFDDIRWNRGMTRFWKEIRTDARFSHVMDLFTFGVAVFAGENHNTLPRYEGPFFLFF